MYYLTYVCLCDNIMYWGIYVNLYSIDIEYISIGIEYF